MASREPKKAVMCNKLQVLRSITCSHAQDETSIISDASKYIEELKQEAETLNPKERDLSSSHHYDSSLPVKIKVKPRGNGFMINVVAERSCDGLLVFILEAFEELGLDVLQAQVSCLVTFHLQAIGEIQDIEGTNRHVDARMLKHAVLQAIQNWQEVSEE